jgi:D-alanyl-D-alanine dipeptidase
MNLLTRYFVLAFLALSVEVLLLYLFRVPLKDISRIPKTLEEIMFGESTFSATLLPDLAHNDSLTSSSNKKEIKRETTFLEQKLIAYGLVNIHSLDTSIRVSLKYSTEDNFLHKNMYGELRNCYLQKDVAIKLMKAQKILKEKYSFYSLIIYDGVRPLSIQRLMWDELKIPEHLKDKYISNPEIGSLHNYGCAVDVNIVNENGWEMDMGTPYDYFGELGHPVAEKKMIEEGKLTWRQYENRKLLREVMHAAGFTGITTEWWHFNGTSLKTAREKYLLIE